MRKLVLLASNYTKLLQRFFLVILLPYLVLQFNVKASSTVCYTNLNTPYSKSFTVVIDPGHGGKDIGTSGFGYIEKDIALDIAMAIGKKLKSFSNIEVIYTRTDDRFIPLHQRVSIANQLEADLFLSIHCNAASVPYVKGIETYIIGATEQADDISVAEKENNSILLEQNSTEYYGNYLDNPMATHILVSSFQNAFLEQSLKLARLLQDNLGPEAILSSRGIRQAGFLVLKNANMPSLLIETGFLSNKEETAYMTSKKGQEEISNSIAVSVAEYLNNVSSLK